MAKEWIVVYDKPEKLLGGHLPGAEDADEGIFARTHVIEKAAYDKAIAALKEYAARGKWQIDGKFFQGCNERTDEKLAEITLKELGEI